MNPYDINDIARDNIRRKAVRDAWAGADEPQSDRTSQYTSECNPKG